MKVSFRNTKLSIYSRYTIFLFFFLFLFSFLGKSDTYIVSLSFALFLLYLLLEKRVFHNLLFISLSPFPDRKCFVTYRIKIFCDSKSALKFFYSLKEMKYCFYVSCCDKEYAKGIFKASPFLYKHYSFYVKVHKTKICILNDTLMRFKIEVQAVSDYIPQNSSHIFIKTNVPSYDMNSFIEGLKGNCSVICKYYPIHYEKIKRIFMRYSSFRYAGYIEDERKIVQQASKEKHPIGYYQCALFMDDNCDLEHNISCLKARGYDFSFIHWFKRRYVNYYSYPDFGCAYKNLITYDKLHDFLNISLFDDTVSMHDGIIGKSIMPVLLLNKSVYKYIPYYTDIAHTCIFGSTGSGKTFFLKNYIFSFMKTYSNAYVLLMDRDRSLEDFYQRISNSSCHETGGSIHWSISSEESFIELCACIFTNSDSFNNHDNEKYKDDIFFYNEDLCSSPFSFVMCLLSEEHRSMLESSIALYSHLFSCKKKEYVYKFFSFDDLPKDLYLLQEIAFFFLLRSVEHMSSDTRPGLIVIDESWTFFQSKRLNNFVCSWLRTLRKKKVGVIFATQDISDISDNFSLILSSCENKIYLPFHGIDQFADIYEKTGLSREYIHILSGLKKKRDYMFMNERHTVSFSLPLSQEFKNLIE